ncbi:precorrin-6A/cobalt-precorrin-6A reductase [Streptomyces boninensis]|uniref:precorrin-6A/cobalt-precorrin-6A reductase n=1 Tax=Streptomyces boninensis TaxID=2039455 RepID=UPI003B21320B
MIVGSTRLADELVMALEYGDQDYVRLDDPERVVDFSAPAFRANAVINAAEPYAEELSATVAAACAQARLPLLRATPPSFARLAGASRWQWVDSFDAARDAAAGFPGAVLTALSPLRLAERLGDLGGRSAGVHRRRLPAEPPLPGWAREPTRSRYGLSGALAAIAEHRARLLVAADSGDDDVGCFLRAAERRDLDVVIVRRPDGGEAVSDAAAAFAWLNGLHHINSGGRADI